MSHVINCEYSTPCTRCGSTGRVWISHAQCCITCGAPSTDYPLAGRYDNLVRSNPRSEAFYRNVQAHDFYLWSNLALVECPHCFESVVVGSALVHLRAAHPGKEMEVQS